MEPNINGEEVLKELGLLSLDLKVKSTKLVIFLGQLCDFDSFEYCQRIVRIIPQLMASKVDFLVIAIGNERLRSRFCSYTGYPESHLLLVKDGNIHSRLGLYSGINLGFGKWVDLLAMCTGIGSPGTLSEVLRGYLGDKNAQEIFESNKDLPLALMSNIGGSIFDFVGKRGSQRPLELATLRLFNLFEILFNWPIYMGNNRFITQRGGTFLFDKNNTLIHKYISRAILDYSKDKSKPLRFLDEIFN